MGKIPESDERVKLSEFFKVFSDPTRLHILYILLEGETNVGDLSERMDISQSAVSHQLKTLRQADLVKFRKEGRSIYYSLKDAHVSSIIRQGREHINE